MYCSNCGAKVTGNFCSDCGAPLTAGQGGSVALQDWKDETRYHVLLNFAEVRDLIARHAAQASKGLTGEQFLGLCDKVFHPLGPIPVSTAVSIIQPIYTRMGIQTGKERTAVLPTPPGKVVVAALCSLARYGRQLKQVREGEDGCVLEACLPSDFWSFEGNLVISIQHQGKSTQVKAATRIGGQLFDWGKSTRCLNQLFEDLDSLLN